MQLRPINEEIGKVDVQVSDYATNRAVTMLLGSIPLFECIGLLLLIIVELAHDSA